MLPIRSVVGGSIIAQKIPTSHFDDENERCRGSGPQGPYRNLPPPTHQSTTTSTTTVTSTAAIFSDRTVLPPWPSGVSLRPERFRPVPFVSSAQVCLTMPLDEIAANLSHFFSLLCVALIAFANARTPANSSAVKLTFSFLP